MALDVEWIAVGMPITEHPPHRTGRAALSGSGRSIWLNPVYPETRGDPSTNGNSVLRGRPWLRAGARCPALRLVHSAGVARIALLIGRVRRLSRSSRHGGAPGERQDDEERGKASWPVHQSPPTGEPISINNKLR
jgi:hypothetical protein